MTAVAQQPDTGVLSVVDSINRELLEKGHLHHESGDESCTPDGTTSPASRSHDESRMLLSEIRAQNFDVIRFATYRTACKLRFIQKKSNLYLVDIWNVIEAFRESNLNTLDPSAEINSAKLESLLSSVFYALNKRLPTSTQISAEDSVTYLLYWLSTAYDPEKVGRMKVLSVKIALATLCAGKLMDKLRYVFTQLSDTAGYLVKSRFEDYLQQVLSLPTAVFEGPSFGYNSTAAHTCFDGKTRITVNDFLDTLMSDPGPQCLMWLPILHRMSQVENVFHPVQCEGCHRDSFIGFRYKCQRCYNYHLCQDCFWRGRTTGSHSNDHEMKEYSSYKSPAKQLTHSLRKSFRCVPAKANHRIPQFPDTPEKTIDLSHIVPPTPVPIHNGFQGSPSSRAHSLDLSSVDSNSQTKSPCKLQGSLDRGTRVDDEHRLIARYAARLAADANDAARSPTEYNVTLDANREQHELIHQLESKNRDILREIQRLRIEQVEQAKRSAETTHGAGGNPTLLAELQLLRQRRDELEGRMGALQESRRELMVQLEGLMKLLKTHGSPKGTPVSSPRNLSNHSPLHSNGRSSSAGGTPNSTSDSLLGMSGDVRQAFHTPSPHGHQGGSTNSSVRSLRNDLLVAADSVTNAMSSLVKELNSEASGSSDEEDLGMGMPYGSMTDSGGDEDTRNEDLLKWRSEMQQRLQQETDFLSAIRARRPEANKLADSIGNAPHSNYIPNNIDSFLQNSHDPLGGVNSNAAYNRVNHNYVSRSHEENDELYDHDPKELMPGRYTTDDESGLETDHESYIRTDDEEGGNTDWEDAMRRWVNR